MRATYQSGYLYDEVPKQVRHDFRAIDDFQPPLIWPQNLDETLSNASETASNGIEKKTSGLKIVHF